MRVVIDEKGINESNPEAGTSLNVHGNIIATGLTINGAISATIPANPTFYVASTGNNSNTGTISSPLATLQEACNRLGVTSWTGTAFIITKDTLNLGANPMITVPAPQAGAYPIVFQGTLTTLVAGIACTGGTNFVTATATAATFTSANGSALNAHRGNILSVVSGANISGTRAIIDTNDGAGTFSVPVSYAAAPTAGNTFDILGRVGKWTWSGQLTMTVVDTVYLDGLEMLPTGSLPGPAQTSFVKVGGKLIETACKWLTSAAGFCIQQAGGGWNSGAIRYSFNINSSSPGYIPIPPGVIYCGCRYDGSAFPMGIGNGATAYIQSPDFSTWDISMFSMQACDPQALRSSFMFISNGQMLDCGVVANGPGSVLAFGIVRLTSGRITPWASAFAGAIVGCLNGALVQISFINFVTPVAGNDLINVTTLANIELNSVSGQAPAGKVFLKIATGARAIVLAPCTATGGTVGSDVTVDAGTAFPVADLNTMAIVGAQNGTFQHSTDSTGTPGSTTINKFSGSSSVATGQTTCVITNSIADVGDHLHLTPSSINAAVTKWSAVVTLNTITITTDAAPTGTAWTFHWQLIKATV